VVILSVCMYSVPKLWATSRDPENESKPAFEHIKLVHSMAGAALFIYLTDCLVKGEPHGVSQVIAAGPAGFQRPKGQPSLADYEACDVDDGGEVHVVDDVLHA